ILEREKQSLVRALFGCERQQVAVEIRDLAARDSKVLAPGQHLGKRALARAVRTHDRVHLAGFHAQIDTAQNSLAVDFDLQIADFKHGPNPSRIAMGYPTAPSRLTPSSFCASTANSIGSSLKTSLQKPFTIIDTASSGDNPRCR